MTDRKEHPRVSGSAGSSAALHEFRRTIVDDAIGRQRLRWPGLFESFSDEQMANTVADTGFHVDFLSSAVWAGEQCLFDDYIGWAKVLFDHLGLPMEWLTGSLADLRDAIGDTLPELHSAPALAVVDACVAAFPRLGPPLPSFIDGERPLGELATRYLVAAISGDSEAAGRIVLDAVDSGVAVPDIYAFVLQPAQLELGRLWQFRSITVGQEHLATGVTEETISLLHPRFATTPRSGKTLLSACVGDEQHTIGLRMVTDMFALDGWGTYYLGPNTPRASIVSLLRETHADVLALSVTLGSHLESLAQTIAAVRSDPATADTPVLVGGYPFNLSRRLWRKVGADAYAPDARSALQTAARLVAL
jgi:methanogenic corrinoid protein MtbC1